MPDEELPLIPHENLMLDVITKQAGTLSKAILEGVMNAVDAGARAVRITMDAEYVRIEDDGHGFRTREEIVKNFGTFGQPHSPFESKTFGAFRMGRGQMFSYGHNLWRSGSFSMELDIKRRGLKYLLSDDLDPVPGCSIQIKLDEQASPLVRAQTQTELQLWCKYAPIDVLFNGIKINLAMDAQKWDHRTPEALVRLTPSGPLSVYNLGIHVAEYPHSRYGTGGIVVSLKQLAVNFARNDILSACPVWRKVAPFLQGQATKRNLRAPGLDDGGRDNLARQIALGEIPAEDALGARIFTTVRGRHLKASDLEEWESFTLAKRGNRRAEAAMETKRALGLSDELLRRFNVDTGEELAKRIQALFPTIAGPVFVDLETLKEEFPDAHMVLPEKEWTPRAAAWIALLNRLGGTLSYGLEIEGRSLVVGSSETAQAWTDASTYIAFNENFLRATPFEVEGMARVAEQLIQMASLRHSNVESTTHDMEFHERYEDLMTHQLPNILSSMCGNGANVLLHANNRLTKKLEASLSDLDRARKADAALRATEDKAPKPAGQEPSDGTQ